ncbi:hypothetical protein LABALGNA3A7_03090 [Dellaglioa algida]|nr:hypothetical protein LABALGNA3A7_03090 [Dellaglioa algida]
MVPIRNKESSNEAKYELLFKCIENLEVIILKDSLLYERKYIGIKIDTNFAQIIGEFESQEYGNLELYAQNFFEIDFNHNKERNKFRTAISAIGKDTIFEIRCKQYY